MNLKRIRNLALGLAFVATPAAVLTAGAAGANHVAGPGGVFIAVCDGYAATIYGTAGNNTIHGTEGADVIVGLGGDDIILGHGGNDRICGGDGADDLYGDGNNDRLFGNGGSDDVFGGSGDDYLHAADGLAGETVSGQTGLDACVADAGDVLSSCFQPAG